MATERDPPMFLHISSPTKTKMEAAVGMANKLINSELGPLVDERRFRKKDDFERDELGRRKWPEEKIYIDMPPIRGFHLRASIVGTGGSNVKFVQSETRTRIQIKGQGSGFLETSTDKESEEPMHLHVTGPDTVEVQRAKGMLEDLIASVRVKYEDFKKNGGAEDDRGRDTESPSSYYTESQRPPAPPGASTGGPPTSTMYGNNGHLAPPPPPSMAAPPFSYSAQPPPPGSSYGTSSYGSAAPPPPPPGGLTGGPGGLPPPPPGSSYGRITDEYDPYTPGRA